MSVIATSLCSSIFVLICCRVLQRLRESWSKKGFYESGDEDFFVLSRSIAVVGLQVSIDIFSRTEISVSIRRLGNRSRHVHRLSACVIDVLASL